MRVLIVGCGYVGLPLGAELAKQGHQVFGLRRSRTAESELRAANIQPLVGDITKPETLARLPRDFGWVVNCVAAGGNAENYRGVYLQGTRNLIAWLDGVPLQKFIYTSSTSVYAQNDGSWVDEDSAAGPTVETSKILVETEDVLLDAAKQKRLPAVVLRVAGIYGPERGHWFRQFLKGGATMDGDGARFLNMIHRDDVVGCCVAALQNGAPGEIYNACDDEPVSQKDFFAWLAQKTGRPMPPNGTPNVSVRRRGATNKRVLNRKLKAALGCEFQFPTFREGFGAELKRLGW